MIGWTIFIVLIAGVLAVDLFVVRRRSHDVGMREALTWSAIWVGLALAFAAGVWVTRGHHAGLEFLTAYLVEESLSVDNLFVFLLLFAHFRVPSVLQHKVLFWGIIGALVMRFVFILAGVSLLARFEWIIYLLGALLIYTGVKMFRESDVRLEPEKNPIVKLTRRLIPMSGAYEGDQFFVKTLKGWLATPLFLVVVIINWTDVVFAIDSIPAIFAVTRDTFVIFSSNILAILGLRAMFFVLADAMNRYRYLKPGVALILAFVGVKMALSYWFHISTSLSLAVIVSVLVGAVGLSLRNPPAPGAR